MLILFSTGHVLLSPSSLAPVCNGGQLELTCSVPGLVLTWRFQETIINGTITNRYPGDVHILSSGNADSQNRLVIVNFVNFTYSRLSVRGASPLTSKLVISPVDDSHNGTVVTCIDPISTNTSSSSLYVVNGDLFQGIIPVKYVTCVYTHNLLLLVSILLLALP